MNRKKLLSQNRLKELEDAAETLTQTQVDACAWVMGGSGVGWTKNNIAEILRHDNKPENKLKLSFWGGKELTN